MAIRVRKGKARTAYQVYWDNPVTGKRETETFRDKAEAERFDAEIQYRLKKDRASFAPSEAPPENQTFAVLAAAYLRAKTEMAASTRQTTFYALSSVIIPTIGSKDASGLTKADLKAVEASVRERGGKQTRVNRVISIVKAILNWAEDEGLIPANPVPRYICKRGPSERIPPPSAEEARRLVAASVPHLQRAIILAFSLGVRVGQSELLGLKWEDVDFRARKIRVWSAKKNKSMPWRDIDLREELLLLLAQWKVEDAGLGLPWIIHYKARRVGSIKTAWKHSLERAGITRRIRPYDLRHAFASHALAAGADLKAVAEIMGHADPQMVLRTYQHVLGDLRRDAMSRVPSLAEDDSWHMARHILGPQEAPFDVPSDEPKQ